MAEQTIAPQHADTNADLTTMRTQRDAYAATVQQLTGPAARERLARHLYITALGRHLRSAGAAEWDAGQAAKVDVEDCRTRADEILAVIAGKG